MEVEERECRVCSDRSDGAHFGVDSCRACAAFFKRSVTMNKQYVCRQGGNNCSVKKSVRMCRQCRWRKCLEAGMLPDNAKKSVGYKDNARSPSEMKKVDCGPSEMERPSTSSAFQVVPGASPNSILILSKDRPISLLKVQENFRHFESVRKAAERSITRATYKGIFSFEEVEIMEVTWNTLQQMTRVIVPMVAEFMNNTYEAFNILEQKEKWTVFKSFIPVMWIFEGAHYTVQQFPPEDKRYMMTQTSYFDPDHTYRFFDNSTTTSFDDKEVAKCVLMEKSIRKNQGLIDIYRRIKLSETEFFAVLSLLVWSPCLFTHNNNHIVAVAEAERAKIFHELHLYYRNVMNLEEYSGRLGEVMALICSIQFETNVLLEDMDLMNLLDVFNTDPFIYDFLKS